MRGFEIQYSSDGNEVCVIPRSIIPIEDFRFICDYYAEQGFDKWIPSDERRGYRFVKKIESNDKCLTSRLF